MALDARIGLVRPGRTEAMSMRGIVGSAQIIGRDAGLEVASEVVGAALHERGPVLWVSGEAGIGNHDSCAK